MNNILNESKVLIEVENFVEEIALATKQPRNFYHTLTDLLIQFDQIYSVDFDYSASIGVFIELELDFEAYLNDYDELFYQLKQSSFKQLQRDFKRYYQRQKRQLRDHCYSESKNTEQLVKRMQRISERYARILVVRVDLAYPLNFQDRVNIQTFNDDMRVLRRRLQNQDTIFKGLIEYAWALEQGEEKGYHCHLLLVYKGSERRNAYWLAKQVGKLWSRITKDQGCHFNCHGTAYLKQFSDRNRLGIGMIHRNNPDEVNNMLDTVAYLVRPEKEAQHLRVKTKKRMRTFG